MSSVLKHLTAIPALISHNVVRKSAWGFADQATISATNFATMVLVARVVSPGEFGLYSLTYTGLLFLNSMQSALVVQPHSILGARRSGTEYVTYTTDTGWFLLGFATLISLVALAVASLAATLEWPVASVLFMLAPATAAWQLQEFVRRAMYTRSDIRGAFLNDLVSYGGQFVAVVALHRLGYLTPVAAILALAATSALGFLIGLWQIRTHLDWRLDWRRLRATTGSNWDFGKWLVGGNIAYWTSSQAYPVLAGGLVSIAATGAMRAAQTVIGPTNVLMMALDPLFGPKTATVYAREGLPALREMLSKMQLFVFLTIGAYCVTVAIFAESILRVLYGEQYAKYNWLLVIIALTNFANSLRSPAKICLKALGETSVIFRTYLAASLINLTVGVAAVYVFGFPGVAVGLVLNSATQLAMISHYQSRIIGSTSPLVSALNSRRPLRPHAPERHHA